MVRPDWRVDAPPVVIFEFAILDAPPSAAFAALMLMGFRSRRVDTVREVRIADASVKMLFFGLACSEEVLLALAYEGVVNADALIVAVARMERLRTFISIV
jgi:hypothetical protein